MAPEVIITITILIEEPQPATDHRVYYRHARPRHVGLVHYLHPHALTEWILHVLRHLGGQQTSRRSQVFFIPKRFT